MMNHPVLSFYRKNFDPDLSVEQEELILTAFRQEHYKKKELIFKQGDRSTRHYIIEKGLVRLFLNDYSGKEFNILFAKENQIIGDLICSALIFSCKKGWSPSSLKQLKRTILSLGKNILTWYSVCLSTTSLPTWESVPNF